MFTDNQTASRFEWTEQGQTAIADYYERAGRVVIPHVEAPLALRGTGAAGRLMQSIANHARAHGLSLVPTCPYAAAWFRRHPDQGDVLAS